MGNFIDYLLLNGQKDFDQLALNEVDIACLNELAYLPLADWTGQEALSREAAVLREGLAVEPEKLDFDFLVTRERVQLLQVLLTSSRFADLTLSFYCNEINSEFERQFAAMVFDLPSIKHRQVVFRGTDDSLIGWKEDFQMTYMREIPAQRMATAYLQDYLSWDSQGLVLSGHSKGGNLALYAASHVSTDQQAQIRKIYIFDAPGLHPSVLQSQGYQAIKDKVLAIRPQESIVGVMLNSDLPVKIVASKQSGMEQHLLHHWQVDPAGHFVPVEQASDLSLALEETFKTWQQNLSSQDLKIFVDTFFNLFLDNGIDSLNDFLKWDKTTADKLGRLFKGINELDANKRLLMQKSLSLLVKTFSQTSLQNQKEKLQQGDWPLAKWWKDQNRN